MTRRLLVLSAVLLGVGTIGLSISSAEILYKRARLRCAAPCHRYGHDRPQHRGRLLTDLVLEDSVVQVLNSPRLRPSSDLESVTTSTIPAQGSILERQPPIARPLQDQYDVTSADAKRSAIVRRKRFAARTQTVTVAPVTLNELALSIYETGQLACSGTLTHSGGENGVIEGNLITIAVRGYAANPAAGTGTITGPMLFEFERSVWVSKGEDLTLSLVPCDRCDLVRQHFDEIRHIEVNLQYRNNR